MTTITTQAPRARRQPGRAGRLAAVLAALLLSLACGKKGPPLPPEPRGPLPPTGVAARQVGDRVEIRCGVPPTRGPKPARQLVRAELVRIDYGPGVQAPPDPDAFRRRGELVDFIDADPLSAETRLVLTDDGMTNLPERGVGHTLRYAVRIRDRRGRSSSLVLAEDLVLLAPVEPPAGLRAEPTSDGVRLRWQAPAGEGPFRFNVYRGVTGQAMGEAPLNGTPLTETDYLDDSVGIGESYLYVIRVVLGEGSPPRESADSGSCSVVAEDRFAPASPQGLVVVQEGEAVRLFWNPNRERDLKGYRVYRKVDGEEWSRVGPDVVEQSLFLDPDVQVDRRMHYRVTSIDRADPPNESSPSESVELVVLAEPATPSDTRP